MGLHTAIKTLHTYSRFYDRWALAGPAKASCRAHIMADLLDLPKIAQSKAGVTAIRDEFYKQARIEGDCIANREDAFIHFCKSLQLD